MDRKRCINKARIHIGDGAVVGERTIVTHDVEPYSVVAGSPGTVRKMRFSDSIIEKLLESKWWEYNYQDFKGINGDDDIEAFLFKFNNLKSSGEIQAYKPEILKTDDLLKIKDF